MGMHKRLNQWFVISTFAMLFACINPDLLVASEISLSKGQTVYVPVYSNLIAGPREAPIHLSNTLVIRNTDMHNEIQVSVADYYDTKGVLIKKFYAQPVTLAPLETVYVHLSERDKEGGVGANFIIRWHAAKEVNVPIIECVMVGSPGRAFVSPSQPIKEETK
jgi:hypothetical protein